LATVTRVTTDENKDDDDDDDDDDYHHRHPVARGVVENKTQ
jgi:hypothetical protein